MVGWIIAGISLALLAQLVWAHRRAVMALRRRPAARPPIPDRYPFVTVVRPVKGPDVEQAENFRAALDTGYPGPVETLFVFEDGEDPAYELARVAIADHLRSGAHGEARILLSGAPPPGRTGKIHNMMAGEAEARGDIIAFGDSDTRPDRAVLANLVEHIVADARIGAAFAPAVASSLPRTAGDVGHHIIMNSLLVAGMETELEAGRSLPFLMGHLMAFRRMALASIGGAGCAEGQLVDDMYLGARIVEAGYRNVVGTHEIDVINHGLRFRDFLRLWRRWLFCGRGGIPVRFVRPFATRAASLYLAIVLVAAAWAVGPAWTALPPAALALGESLHYLRLHRVYGGAAVPARLFWMAWMPYLLAVPIGVSMLVRPQLEWRGHTYRVDLGARLQRNGPTRGHDP